MCGDGDGEAKRMCGAGSSLDFYSVLGGKFNGAQ